MDRSLTVPKILVKCTFSPNPNTIIGSGAAPIPIVYKLYLERLNRRLNEIVYGRGWTDKGGRLDSRSKLDLDLIRLAYLFLFQMMGYHHGNHGHDLMTDDLGLANLESWL